MKETYWFTSPHFFDYNRQEEVEDLKKEFHNPDNVFLVASDNTGTPVGVIGLKVNGEKGTIRRWEPAVPQKKNRDVGIALINKISIIAKERGVQRLGNVIKFPFEEQEPWHCQLYRKLDFDIPKLGVNLINKLDGIQPDITTIPELKPCGEYSVDEVAEFTLRAFASTPEDIEIHKKDTAVSDPESVREIIRVQRAGKMGDSPPDINKVALVGVKPAGFIRCFIREEKYRPHFGLIGILGVFPEYRRRGIGYALINHSLRKFTEYGLQYAYVGTSVDNHKAIEAYKKAGFQPIFRQITFEKKI